MDKDLEERLRDAIFKSDKIHQDMSVSISKVDAKRLLYRLKKENSQDSKLVYRKDKS